MALKAIVLCIGVLLLIGNYCNSQEVEEDSTNQDWDKQLGSNTIINGENSAASNGGSESSAESNKGSQSSTTNSGDSSSNSKTGDVNTGQIQAVEHQIKTSDGIVNTILSFAISAITNLQKVLTRVNSASKSMQSVVTSMTDTLGSRLSTPEKAMLHIIGYVLSTIIQNVGSMLSFLPVVGDRLSSSSHLASICASSATQELSNTIPTDMMDCVLSPVTNIDATIAAVTSELEQLGNVVREVTSETYTCDNMMCTAREIGNSLRNHYLLIGSLIYNIVTGVLSIGGSLGGLMPCIMTSVPRTMIYNIFKIGQTFVGCLIV